MSHAIRPPCLHAAIASLSENKDPLLYLVFELICEHYSESDYGLADFCRETGMSASQLYRKIKLLTGRSANYFLRRYRLEAGRRLLALEPAATVAAIAYRIGFSDPNYFSQAFTRCYGQSPTQYRAALPVSESVPDFPLTAFNNF